MEAAKKDERKVNNNLKRFLTRFTGEDAQRTRIDYGKLVVDYLAKPENGGYTVQRNHVYQLVNDYIRITPGNIHIAKAVKAVAEQFESDLEQLVDPS